MLNFSDPLFDPLVSCQTVDDWLSYLEQLHPTTIELGLERVSTVKEALALRPQFKIITVAGTNGKGSTCAMLDAILQAASYRVGFYNSPHLLVYNERVRIQGTPISDPDLIRSFIAVENARRRAQVSLTYFEFGTLAALWYFDASQIEVAILEVGLGGRLDAVNVFDPDLAIITQIDLDHQAYLGTDREQIGFEKAGILRAGKPALCADPNPPQSLIQHAASIGAQLACLGQDFGYVPQELQWQTWHQQKKRYSLPYPALRGAYQLMNASTALAALDFLSEWGFPTSPENVRRGLLEVSLPGRCQVLPGRPTRILDVGHNPHAMRSLAKTLGQMGFAEQTYAVFSLLKDKDIQEVIKAIQMRIDMWYIAPLDTARGCSAEFLYQNLCACGVPAENIKIFENITFAWQNACKDITENDRIVAFGSFYTVAEILTELRRNPD